MAKTEKSNNVTVVKSHRKANIAVIIIASITALVLITIAVLCAVRVDPTRDIAEPDHYDFYDLSSTSVEPSHPDTPSKIRAALDDMDFSVMTAILQWRWDYSYNFKRNANGDKIEMTADDVASIGATATEYMIEYVYTTVTPENGKLDMSKAQSMKVDGETVYFDRLKMVIGNTSGSVGTISLYPYLSFRIKNESDIDDLASDTYKITGINVRADTTKAYAALKDLAASLN